MVGDGFDPRWWNLSLGVLAASVIGCGPTVFLPADTEGGTGTESVGDTDTPMCVSDSQCADGTICIDGSCVPGPYDEYSEYSEYSDRYCYEYGPNGECCDYQECPEICETPRDCLPGTVCSERGGYCELVPYLELCPEPALPVPLPIDVGDEDIVALAFLDADGDAEADLLVAPASGGASLYRMSTMAPQSVPIPVDAGTVTAAAAGDFTGDLVQDLVIATSDGDTHVLAGDGAGGFVSLFLLTGNGVMLQLRALEFDGMPGLDLAARNSGAAAFVFDAVGLSPNVIGLDTQGGIAYSLTTGQLDGMPWEDVAVSRPLRDEWFFAPVGGGSEDPAITGVLGWAVDERRFETADFDGDGVDALLAATPLPGWTYVQSARPQGVAHYGLESSGRLAGVGDYDGDGVPDLALAGDALLWLLGSPNPDFDEVFDCAYLFLWDGVPDFETVGDYDGNGRMDVAVAIGSQVIVHLAP